MNIKDLIYAKFEVQEEKIISDKVNYFITCPYCLHNNDSGLHCSIVISKYSFLKCFSCGTYVSLSKIFNIETAEIVPNEKPKIEREQVNYDIAQKTYESNPEKYIQWSKYKNVSRELVDKYRLGYGTLSGTRHNRLICPIYFYDELQLLRGRLVEKSEKYPTWLNATGSVINEIDLIFSDRIKKGNIILLVENYVDALIFNEKNLTIEKTPVKAIPTLSVSIWGNKWTEQLLNLVPKKVIICYDSDLAGNGVPHKDLEYSLKQWLCKVEKCENDQLKIISITNNDSQYLIQYNLSGLVKTRTKPLPRGFLLKNKFDSLGVNSILFRWDKVGIDLGEVLCAK